MYEAGPLGAVMGGKNMRPIFFSAGHDNAR